MKLAALALLAQVVATSSPAPAQGSANFDTAPEEKARSIPSVYELFAGCNGGLGVFILEFTVTTKGTVKNPRVVRGPYCAAAEERMLKAVRAWRYTPARKNGRAVAAHVTVTVAPGG